MPLAIFDLDDTLINGDSDHAWGEFLVSQQRVDSATYKQKNDAFYRDYREGRLDYDEYLAFALAPFAQIPKHELLALRDTFMRDIIAPMLQDSAVALLQQHRNAGDFILVITSTSRFVVEPICQLLGVDALIATELETDTAGNYTGRPTGLPSYQEGKITRLQQWLAENTCDMQGSSFYSDSINDLPLLLEVDRPVAVDPDDKLRKEAEARGWEIISLRDS